MYTYTHIYKTTVQLLSYKYWYSEQRQLYVKAGNQFLKLFNVQFPQDLLRVGDI
jgi:hypothetical protein